MLPPEHVQVPVETIEVSMPEKYLTQPIKQLFVKHIDQKPAFGI